MLFLLQVDHQDVVEARGLTVTGKHLVIEVYELSNFWKAGLIRLIERVDDACEHSAEDGFAPVVALVVSLLIQIISLDG